MPCSTPSFGGVLPTMIIPFIDEGLHVAVLSVTMFGEVDALPGVFLSCLITKWRFHSSLFSSLFVSLRTEGCPHVFGEAHPCGLRDRGADDGVHAQHDAGISAIMKSSWRVSHHGLVTVWLGVQVFLQGKLVSQQVSLLDGYISSSCPLCYGVVFLL